MRKNQVKNLPRLIIQWMVIVWLIILVVRPMFQKEFKADFEAYCPFGGIQSLSSYFLNNSLACSMTTTQIAMGIMLIIGIFLFSKLFCSFICPVGTISEWLGKVGEKSRFRFKLSGRIDKLLRSFKYLLLFVTFYFTLDSSELFCKKYDPYFAVASGFSLDVVVFYAITALTLVLIGSFLIRLFWCKYLCPLGAVSNMIKFVWFPAGIILVYFLLLKTGLQLSFGWPLAVACLGGYLLEIRGEKLNFIPVTKITRNEQSCTNCRLCNRKCPQSIDVAGMKVVRDADCNLCGDCLEVCPEKDTLQINKKSGLNWILPVAVLVLLGLGLLLGSTWELPTIDLRWGNKESLQKAAVFEQSGISEIKCFSSSMALATKMKQVKGVLGVATFVSSHRARILFDSTMISKQLVQSELFTPRKTIIRTPDKEVLEIKMVTVMLENFFDPTDFDKLSVLLKENTDALGLESQFSCPVTVKIYFPGSSEINESLLTDLLNNKKSGSTTGKTEKRSDWSFRPVKHPEIRTIKAKDYHIRIFEPYRDTFNWKENYRENRTDTLTVPFGRQQYNMDSLIYLVSHISHDHGIVGFQTSIDSTEKIFFKIIYLDSLTNRGRILKNINSDTLTVNFEGGAVEKIANSFGF